MASEESASAQLQPFLPGMGPSSAIGKAARAQKKPHQMTPEEFAAAPLAVFHSSHYYPEDVKRTDNRRADWKASIGTSPHIHVGTEQAAIENAARTENNDVGSMAEDTEEGTKEARLHTYWYQPKPGDLTKVHDDGEVYNRPEYGDMHPDELAEKYKNYDPEKARLAGDFDPKYEYSHDVHPFPSLLYKNSGEDRGSLSLSVAKPSRLKTQGDYVREAISQGKGDEVHPKTMAMFKAGHLDKGAVLPLVFAERVARENGTRYADHGVSHPEELPFEDRRGVGVWGEFPSPPEAPKRKYSDFGPDFETIKRMSK